MTAVDACLDGAGWRHRLATLLELPKVQQALIGLILINAVILGMETSSALMADWGEWLKIADKTILAIFVVEIALRLIAHRFSYFRDPWNVFDFSVVLIALLPASGPLAVLRALRVLRVLRLVTLVPSMKRVVGVAGSRFGDGDHRSDFLRLGRDRHQVVRRSFPAVVRHAG